MASIGFDKSSGWWSIRYYAGPSQGRVKQMLGKQPPGWSKSRPPKKPPPEIERRAHPFREQERLAKMGQEAPRVRRTALASYVAEYLIRVTATFAENTLLGVKTATSKFVAYCEGRGVNYLQDVTYSICRDWVASRLSGGAKRSTVVTERSHLHPIWAQALQERLIAENPWAGAKVPGKSRKEVPTAWTRDEAGKLVAAFDDGDWIKDMIRLGLNTGIRISALLALRWEQVDWDAGLIRVRATNSKSGRPYDVPITPTAHDVLAGRLARTADGKGLIFPSPRGVSYVSRTTFERIKRAVKRAGIPDYGDFNHVLRRTFATIALNSGVALEVVSKCLDHAHLSQTESAYAHVLNERLKSGMAGFDL